MVEIREDWCAIVTYILVDRDVQGTAVKLLLIFSNIPRHPQRSGED